MALEGFKHFMYICCPESEVRKLQAHHETNNIPPFFYHYDFLAYGNENLLPKLFIYMITDTFRDAFNMNKLCRFILTVRNNYRPVTYHNFQHAFQVGLTLNIAPS